ncbi:MAG: glycosyl transferase family 2 [Anaerolineaceae bacterium]|nr:glycosyl transferase family 2 [Anaerolineaceae bacterium]
MITWAGCFVLSIVIPVHNEEAILPSLVRDITTGLQAVTDDYELILCENGSADRTLALAHELAEQFPAIHVFTSDTPSYGQAIRTGILHSQGEHIVVFNADLWDLEFLRSALHLMDFYDIVVASKRHQESHDQRPLQRRFITWSFNALLRVLFSFHGSDTHGMKAFRRRRIVPIVESCLTQREIFDTEVILRAQRAGLSIIEVPVHVEETRPSRYGLFMRIPRTFHDLSVLYRDLYTVSRTAPVELPSEPDKV